MHPLQDAGRAFAAGGGQREIAEQQVDDAARELARAGERLKAGDSWRDCSHQTEDAPADSRGASVTLRYSYR